jgi:hypothetical protein
VVIGQGGKVYPLLLLAAVLFTGMYFLAGKQRIGGVFVTD